MVLDTSAILAILNNEPERHTFNRLIAAADKRVISAATYAETGIVVAARYGPAGSHFLNTFLARAAVEVVTLEREQSDAAVAAYERFGKGRHPAGLNFGDCFSYALARFRAEPLLFKGDDFSLTDVVPAADADNGAD